MTRYEYIFSQFITTATPYPRPVPQQLVEGFDREKLWLEEGLRLFWTLSIYFSYYNLVVQKKLFSELFMFTVSYTVIYFPRVCLLRFGFSFSVVFRFASNSLSLNWMDIYLVSCICIIPSKAIFKHLHTVIGKT